MNKQFAICHRNGALQPIERQALEWLGEQEKWIGACAVTRKTNRLFDLKIVGTSNRYDSPVVFEAWFPLACLHAWWGDRKWGCYLPAFDDWSQIRDMARSTQWAYFNDVVKAAMAQQPKQNVFVPQLVAGEFEFRKGKWLMQPAVWRRKKDRRGITSFCTIFTAKTREYVGMVEDTPHEIVARCHINGKFHDALRKEARKTFGGRGESDSYVLSEYLRDLTMQADQAWMNAEKQA